MYVYLHYVEQTGRYFDMWGKSKTTALAATQSNPHDFLPVLTSTQKQALK